MSGQRRELVYIYRAPPLALAGLDALAGSVLLFRPIGFRVARYLPGRRSGFRQHALADQHFVRNPECIAWVTGQPEIPVVEETGVSKTGSRFYAGSGTIPIQNMVLSRTSMSVYGWQTFGLVAQGGVPISAIGGADAWLAGGRLPKPWGRVRT